MTETSKKDYVSLEWISCIYYPLRFQKDTIGIKALIDSGNKFNAMTLAYASELGLNVHYTDVGAQMIDSSTLKYLE